MALSTKKYSAVHTKTGSEKSKLQTHYDEGHINTLSDLGNDGHPEFGALIYQIQEMQDELDYLRTEISDNKDKKSMTLGTSGSTALAGDTNIVTIGSSTTISFGDMITVPAKGKTPASYSIVMTVTNGGVSKTTTLTLT
jgi:hypothetical protein